MGEREEMGLLVLLGIRESLEPGGIMVDQEDRVVQDEEELQGLRGQQAIQDQLVLLDQLVFQDLRVNPAHKEYRGCQEAWVLLGMLVFQDQEVTQGQEEGWDYKGIKDVEAKEAEEE